MDLSGIMKRKGEVYDTFPGEDMENIYYGPAVTRADFRFIANFGNMKEVQEHISPATYIRGLPWRIVAALQPDPNSDEQDAISLCLYIECNPDDKSENWSCRANVALRIKINNVVYASVNHDFKGDEISGVFNSKNTRKQSPDLIPHSMRNEYYTIIKNLCIAYSSFPHDYVKDNSIIIEAMVKADAPQGVNWDNVIKSKRVKLDNSLLIDLGGMLDDIESHDVTLKCGEAQLTAHKSILGGRSPVFKAMFRSDMKESRESTVEVKDFSPEAVQGMLRWMYTGVVDENDKKFGLDILKLAHCYEMPALMEEIQGDLIEGIEKENVVDMLVQVSVLGAKKLKEATIGFILRNKEILDTEEFKEKVSWELLCEILKASA